VALHGTQKAFLICVVADQDRIRLERWWIAGEEIPDAIFKVVCAGNEDLRAKAQLTQDGRCRRRLWFALEGRGWQATRPAEQRGGANLASRC
jgi:hypothetical protein